MSDEQFDDLKQLIQTSASQTEQNLKQDMDKGFSEVRNRMGDGFAKVRKEMNTGFVEVSNEMGNGFAGVGEAITPLNDAVDDHERRLTKLEPHAL
jgi:hypothetical protein